MNDVLLQSLKAELGGLQARVGGLESEVEQLRRVRDMTLGTFLQLKWCITCLPVDEDEEDEDEPEYPTSGTVFPIKFLDAHFTAAVGNQSFDKTERSEEAVAFAFCAQYVPIDTVCPVFWLRGLGEQDKGEWWLLRLGGPQFYVTNGGLAHGGTVELERLQRGGGGWERSGQMVTGYDIFLNAADAVDEGTIVSAVEYEGLTVIDSIYCKVNNWLGP